MNNEEIVAEYRATGFCVLPSIFTDSEITDFRAIVLRNLGVMGRTREATHSRHLAGFHRFPALAALHTAIASDRAINDFVSKSYSGRSHYAIGLSDITVNRSQHWHTDRLRGRYRSFLDGGLPWTEPEASCVKALVYLQDGASLCVVPGSHLASSPLDDDQLASLARSQEAVRVSVRSGDVVMLDIRTVHRGASDEEMNRPELADSPKILCSTVFGPIGSAFAHAMQVGNAHRMADWDLKYLSETQPSVSG